MITLLPGIKSKEWRKTMTSMLSGTVYMWLKGAACRRCVVNYFITCSNNAECLWSVSHFEGGEAVQRVCNCETSAKAIKDTNTFITCVACDLKETTEMEREKKEKKDELSSSTKQYYQITTKASAKTFIYGTF